MTRRNDALIPLSHNHHHALHNIRLLRKAAMGDDAERLAAAQAFVEFFRTDSVPHFREEEEEILPLVAQHPEAPTQAMARLLMDHVRLHALVRALDQEVRRNAVDADAMCEIADLLRAHIRFEEDQLFPEIERLATEELGCVTLRDRGSSRLARS